MDVRKLLPSAPEEFVGKVGTHRLVQLVLKPIGGRDILDLNLTNEQSSVNNVLLMPPVGNSDHHSLRF